MRDNLNIDKQILEEEMSSQEKFKQEQSRPKFRFAVKKPVSMLNSRTKKGLHGRKQCRGLDDRAVAFAIRRAKEQAL